MNCTFHIGSLIMFNKLPMLLVLISLWTNYGQTWFSWPDVVFDRLHLLLKPHLMSKEFLLVDRSLHRELSWRRQLLTLRLHSACFYIGWKHNSLLLPTSMISQFVPTPHYILMPWSLGSSHGWASVRWKRISAQWPRLSLHWSHTAVVIDKPSHLQLGADNVASLRSPI